VNGLNRLQQKIGGRADCLDQTELLAAAQCALDALVPQLQEALSSSRAALRAATVTSTADLSLVFLVAHHIRSFAGTVGKPSMGRIADCLATYLAECREAGGSASISVVQALVAAIDRAFDVEEGSALLLQIVNASSLMVMGMRRASGPCNSER
jgi:hypothetical protein